jgi:hypothetical protein
LGRERCGTGAQRDDRRAVREAAADAP